MPDRPGARAASRPSAPALSRNGTRVTIETALDDDVAESLYGLYLESFEPLRGRAVARQVLYRDEFFEEMRDPRVWKYLTRDRSGQACGLSTLTQHLETVPWISPEYFAAHYPEHAARRAIYYLGFTLVSAEHRRSRVFEQMISMIVDRIVADNGVCAYDICAYNNEALRFADNIEALLHRSATVTVDRLDTQTYYCADFSGGRR